MRLLATDLTDRERALQNEVREFCDTELAHGGSEPRFGIAARGLNAVTGRSRLAPGRSTPPLAHLARRPMWTCWSEGAVTLELVKERAWRSVWRVTRRGSMRWPA
jgi:hypothetical protein